MKDYRKASSWLVAAWFVIVCCASGLQLYRNSSNSVGIAVAVSALAPILVFVLWYGRSSGFREFVLSRNARTLTWIQSWRLAGIWFVILQARGILPAVFALPAGFGDMVIGATAFAASRLAGPRHRTGFLIWQALGIADLVAAVGLGTTARLFGGDMTAMTVLPLSLVPTFIVPLLFIFHLICIAQSKAWNTVPRTLPDRYDLASVASRPVAQ